MKVKEKSEKAGLKLNIKKKKKDHGIGPITSWQRVGETMEIVTDFIFWGSQITAEGDGSHEIKREGWEPLPDKAQESTLQSQSGGEK